MRLAPCLLSLIACSLPAADARAETYATCAGFIPSIPTTISTQGVWCMDKDLSSALASGSLVTIATNNVTIDCNGFKLGGLAAGTGTQAKGILAVERANITIRNCNIRGFGSGISLLGSGGYGHVIEDNRLDGNTVYGAYLDGTGHAVRRNIVVDTGGSANSGQVGGLWVQGQADVIDNTVDGVHPTAGTPSGSVGIAVFGAGSVIQGNRIRDVDGGSGFALGIASMGEAAALDGNFVANGNGAGTETGILCSGTKAVRNNTVFGYDGPISSCGDHGGNVTAP